MKLKKYEPRITVTKKLYHYILQEADNRNAKMATVAREKLAEYFMPPEKPIHRLQASNNSNEYQDYKIILASLLKTEKQLSSVALRIESLLAFSHERVDFLVTMIDQFYLDLMRYFPEIPEEFVHAAESNAKLRYNHWLKTITAIVNNKK
jgi:hypothetical protein